ncbi:MAG: hypothetical protein ABJF86_15510 [Tateyamaria sp.]|uniref:hypothetical protein n=1 Tax=Tateyamaria sp. TaxID=1929288 RepID=UPI00328DEBB8
MKLEHNFFNRLKTVSPLLHKTFILAIGSAAGFSLFTIVNGERPVGELLFFIGFCVVLYAISTIFAAVTKTERGKVIFSALVLIVSSLGYVVLNFDTLSKTLSAPSVQVKTTWCEYMSFACVTQSVEGSVVLETIDQTNPTAAVSPEGSSNRVFFMFSGNVSRDNDIKPYLIKLLKFDWNGQEFLSGGKRTKDADGYNEVRYYFEQDLETAQQLATDVNFAEPPKGLGKDLRIVKLDPTGYPLARIGDLEIWLSQ